MAKILKVKLVRGIAGKTEHEKNVLSSLGLRKINQIKEHDDNPVIRGMIKRVFHLVKVVD
jgi:large subunit ribosomal protein L30